MIGYYALAVHLRTADPAGAERFLVESLGFRIALRGEGWTNLENGALVLRLSAGEPTTAIELEVVTRDPEATCRELAGAPGVRCLQPPVRVAESRVEARLATPFGFVLAVGRDLDEDDLGRLPELPKELVWPPAVERLIQELLREVPLAFRSDARGAATQAAEAAALERGWVEVGQDDAVRGLIRVTPRFRRDRWRTLLAERGIDPARFAAEWPTA